MAKPIIKAMTPFDKSEAYLVTFVWKGNMAYNNRLVIYDSESNLVVYDHTYAQNYYRLQHEIPANTLSNGKKYIAQIQVIDKDGLRSEMSEKMYFWTETKPTFRIDGLDSNSENEINSSNYTALLYYAQPDGDALDSYQFFLYSSVKELLDSSDIYRTGSSQKYTFRSLENDTNYYFRVTGYTKKNVPLDTGLILVFVHYTNPAFYARMYATVNPVVGTVDYNTNLVNIETDAGSAAYEYEDGYVDLIKTDLNATLRIETDSPLKPRIGVDFLNAYDEFDKEYSDEGDSGITIHDYLEIREIEIYGKSATVRNPVVSLGGYMPGDYDYAQGFSLIIGDTVISNVIDDFPLRDLPQNNISDKFVIDYAGNRYLYRNVGETVITSTLDPVSTAFKQNNYGRRMFVTYYDIGAKPNMAVNNLYCDNLPVNQETTSVFLTTEGYLGVQWDYTETLVDRIARVRNWLAENPLKVLYPLDSTQCLRLEPVVMPKMKNNHSARYSHNFKVPKNATFSIRMKECWKTAEIFRVQTDEKDVFIVTSMIYDDETLRFKLTAFGPNSNYVIYSEPLVFKRWDLITLHIRRIDGLYDMTVFITEQDPNECRNIWLMTSEPRDERKQDRDIWLDLDYPTTYVSKDMAVRVYSNTKPTDVNAYETCWIGR